MQDNAVSGALDNRPTQNIDHTQYNNIHRKTAIKTK